MSNADKPAYPLNGEKWQGEIGRGVAPQYYQGLTKREYFAAMAMNSIVAFGSLDIKEEVIRRSIEFADELLNQLDK